jgi:hypothetical protein
MIRAKLLAVALMLAGATGTAAAQKLSFDCNAPAGKTSRLDQLGRSKDRAVTGSLTARASYDHPDALPSVQIRYARLDDRWWVQITLKGERNSGQLHGEVTVHLGSGEEESFGLGSITAGQPAEFYLGLDSYGNGTARLGGSEHVFDIQRSGETARASVVCSTGDFLFTDLDFGG